MFSHPALLDLQVSAHNLELDRSAPSLPGWSLERLFHRAAQGHGADKSCTSSARPASAQNA